MVWRIRLLAGGGLHGPVTILIIRLANDDTGRGVAATEIPEF